MDGSVRPKQIWASSRSGLRFEIQAIGRHAQDCSWPMVVYTNLEPTEDAPPGTTWVLDELIFVKRMRLVENP